MQGHSLAIPIIIPGTMSADAHFEFKAPFKMKLIHVSANCDASTSFILDIGENDTPDPDAYLDAQTVTGNDTDSTEFTLGDFVDGKFPVIEAGENVVITIDHDGGVGDPAANVSALLTFVE